MMAIAGVVCLAFLHAGSASAQGSKLRCLGKRITVMGTDESDVLVGTSRSDVIWAGGGDDQVSGGGGNDVICGDGGDDRIDGGPGSDRLDGGTGSDTVSFAEAVRGVTVSLALGTARSASRIAHRRLRGETDRLYGFENVVGSAFADRLSGDSGVNLLRGLEGNDRLEGNGGSDTLVGDDGADTCSNVGLTWTC